MFRKIALILIQSFLVQYGVLLQALVVFVLLIIFIVLNMTKQPFQTETLNHLEIMSLLASMVTVYCGIFYIVDIDVTDADSGATSSSSGIEVDETTKVFFFFVIVIANIAFLAYWIFKMIEEVKSMLVKKFSFIYTMVCLCGHKEKYERILREI